MNSGHDAVTEIFRENTEWNRRNNVGFPRLGIGTDVIFDVLCRFVEYFQSLVADFLEIFAEFFIHLESVQQRIGFHVLQQIIRNAAIARTKFNDAVSFFKVNVADDLLHQPRRAKCNSTGRFEGFEELRSQERSFRYAWEMKTIMCAKIAGSRYMSADKFVLTKFSQKEIYPNVYRLLYPQT